MSEVSSEREYHDAVRRIFDLMVDDPAANTPEGEELARLTAAVERFESERFPISCCAFASKDCAARLLALLRQLGAIYDLEGAAQWCETPQPLLDGQRPVDMLVSDKGAAEVAAVVARLRDGAHI